MKLPNGDKAVVLIEKLDGYSLNPEHGIGKHKARVFMRALGMDQGHAAMLREVLLEHAQTSDAIKIGSNEFGDHYFVDFLFEHEGKKAELRSKWTIRKGENFPRLGSCYVKRRIKV
jgi:hypothetical protein